jgi:hypothetical protein
MYRYEGKAMNSITKTVLLLALCTPVVFSSHTSSEELVVINCASSVLNDFYASGLVKVYSFIGEEVLVGTDLEGLQKIRQTCSKVTALGKRKERYKYFLFHINEDDIHLLEGKVDLIYYENLSAIGRSNTSFDLSTCSFIKGLTWISFTPVPLSERQMMESTFTMPDSLDSIVLEIMDQVDRSQFASIIQRLQDFQTRYSYTDSCRASELWVHDSLSAMGYETELLPFQYEGETWYNVVARKTGVLYPDSIYIISGHIDSRSYEDPYNLAPGAEDNATAVAAVMEAARIFTRYDFGCTIEFFVPSGEEQGLIGSAVYAQQCYGSSKNIAGVLNYDMISYADDYGWNLVIYADANFPAEQQLAELYAFIVDEYTDAFPERLNTNGPQWGSDHYHFSLLGFPAIFGIDAEIWTGDDWYPWYHSTDDVIDHLVLDFGVEVVKSGVATMAILAGLAEPPVCSVEITPDNAPIRIPQGGSFTFDGTVTNNTSEYQTIDVWTMIDVPGYGPYGPIRLHDDITLSPDQIITVENIHQSVPINAPTGEYSYFAYCGDHPSNIINRSSFPFSVQPEGGGFIDFEDVPQNYWFNSGNQNLSCYYYGLCFGPHATILEDEIYGYNSDDFPPHSGHAVLFSFTEDYIRVDFDDPVNHAGVWYTAWSTFYLEGYDSTGNLLNSTSGPYNSGTNTYLEVNADDIFYVVMHDSGNHFTVDDFDWTSRTLPLSEEKATEGWINE